MATRLLTTSNDPVMAIIRVLLGLVMFPHGAQKMLGWFGGYGISATVAGMAQSGLPEALVYLVIFIEFFGSLGLIFGLLARPSALGILSVMIGAVLRVHLPNGFFMNWSGQQKGEGYEYHMLAVAIAVAILIRGAGAWSLDRILSKKT